MFGKIFQFLSKDKEREAAPPKAKAAVGYQSAMPATDFSQSPESLCGIAKGMSPDEIRAQLATLYKRYNRAASSLDASMRAEAETMLDAIVTVREKHFGTI